MVFKELSLEEQARIRNLFSRATKIKVFPQILREAISSIPMSGYSAPLFGLTRRENHGMGYHSHLEMLKSGRYIRAGYIITLDNRIVIAVPHNQQLFDIDKKRNAVIEEIKPYVERTFAGIPQAKLLRPSRDAVHLFAI